MVDEERMLTTIDNPYNPFTQFEDWNAWDIAEGYCTNAYLARIARTSDDLSEADESSAIDQAMNEIVAHNVSGMHIIVTPSTFLTPEQRSEIISSK